MICLRMLDGLAYISHAYADECSVHTGERRVTVVRSSKERGQLLLAG